VTVFYFSARVVYHAIQAICRSVPLDRLQF
jgi:hypothetical protein